MSSKPTIAEQQNALVKTVKGTALQPYSAVERPIASFFGMPVDYESLKARQNTQTSVPDVGKDSDKFTLAERGPDDSIASTIRQAVKGIFSKQNVAPVKMESSNNLSFYGINRNNSVATGLVKAAMTPNNVRANAMRRATERMRKKLANNSIIPSAVSSKPNGSSRSRSRRARKSKVHTRRRR